MHDLLHNIRDSGPDDQHVLQSGTRNLTRAELVRSVERLARYLKELDLRCVALYADNGIDWILADLACHAIGIRIVPVPLFFSAEQVDHTITQSGVQALITDQNHAESIVDLVAVPTPQNCFPGDMALYMIDADESVRIPAGTQKITYTSGSTGTPKGVCLSADHQLQVADALAAAVPCNAPRHLCVLPLSTLLENLAGVYAPLLSGGTVIVAPLSAVGIAGSCGLNIKALMHSIDQAQPNTLILVPEILDALTTAAECGWRPPSSLQFVAVGGGKVAPQLLSRARACDLRAFEGYGLSECASVVTLNVPGADRPGAVGKPLPHVAVSIEEGEIVISGSEFLGYANQPDSWDRGAVRSGDLGHIDSDGFVVVSGRAKSQIITSFGRNISPEWVESELIAGPLLQQAVVVGDARPYCVALLYPRNVATTDDQIMALIQSINQRLPDYARVLDWQRMPEPNTPQNGLMTASGKPKRADIENHYRFEIENIYATRQEVANQ
jgi:long-chain acyl-CoA synthetase